MFSVEDENPPVEQGEAVQWMNHRYAVVPDNGKVLIVWTDTDPAMGNRRILRTFGFQAFKDYFTNRTVNVRNVDGFLVGKINLGKFWLAHPDRRTMGKGIIFDPTDRVSPTQYYNLWSGFSPLALAQQEEPYPAWTMMRSHILEVICGGNEEFFDYVIGWMATGVQVRDRPAGTALVLKGDEGIGKGVFARAYGKLFGNHWVHLTDARQLTGVFNAHLEDAIVVFADEAVGTADKATIGKLKGLITEPTLLIEAKYRNAHTAMNCARVILASNNEWIVPAGKDARRYCVLSVSNRYRGNREYFHAIEEEMARDGYGAMLAELELYDLSDFNIFDVPETAALLEQKLHSLSPEWAWWLDRLHDGKLLSDHTLWRTVVSRKEVREEYDAVVHPLVQGRHMPIQFLLRSVLPDEFPGNGGRLNGDRKWTLPPLTTCREHFERLLGHPIDWED